MLKHDFYDTPLEIEGAPVVYVREGRILKEHRHEQLYYYDMRHDDCDWSEPCTIEIDVMVNHFGVLVTSAPIPSLVPKADDPKGTWYRIGIHPEEEPDNGYIQECIMHLLQGDYEAVEECLSKKY